MDGSESVTTQNPRSAGLERLAHWYFGRFPIDRGKWRVWEKISPLLKYGGYMEVEKKIRNDICMKLDLSDHIDQVIYYWNCWEPYETWAMEEILRPGDVCVDIGANIGYFTLVASQKVGSEGKVFSFEPMPLIARRLRENVELNHVGNVVVFDSAASDKPGLVKIGKPSGANSGMSSMRTDVAMEEVCEVRADRLDNILPNDLAIRLLKIDVEGAELRVLKGIEGHLRNGLVSYILCEVMDAYLKSLGSSAADLYFFLQQFGYQAYSCKNRKFSLIGLDDMKRPWQVNVIFSRQHPRI